MYVTGTSGARTLPLNLLDAIGVFEESSMLEDRLGAAFTAA